MGALEIMAARQSKTGNAYCRYRAATIIARGLVQWTSPVFFMIRPDVETAHGGGQRLCRMRICRGGCNRFRKRDLHAALDAAARNKLSTRGLFAALRSPAISASSQCARWDRQARLCTQKIRASSGPPVHALSMTSPHTVHALSMTSPHAKKRTSSSPARIVMEKELREILRDRRAWRYCCCSP
jgi:hypothetical protein